MSMSAKKALAVRSAPGINTLPDGLEVWLDDPTFGPLAHLGRLHRSAPDSVRFEYSPLWLKNAAAFALDPELSLASGNFHPKDSNFGIFMDSCPDRWGQTLMKRREVVEARQQERARRELRPWDFFLGVQDVTRMGALRFSALQSDKQLKQGPPPAFVDGSTLANQALAAPTTTMTGRCARCSCINSPKSSDWTWPRPGLSTSGPATTPSSRSASTGEPAAGASSPRRWRCLAAATAKTRRTSIWPNS